VFVPTVELAFSWRTPWGHNERKRYCLRVANVVTVVIGLNLLLSSQKKIHAAENEFGSAAEVFFTPPLVSRRVTASEFRVRRPLHATDANFRRALKGPLGPRKNYHAPSALRLGPSDHF
jgi:hypothetical protein